MYVLLACVVEWSSCPSLSCHRLGYATAADVIEIKGRVACEIDS